MSRDSHPSAEAVDAAATRDLRRRVLRPHQPIEACVYPLDDRADTGHYGVRIEGRIVAVGSIFHEARDDETDAHAWRIRGMATEPDLQGKGHGGKVIEALVDHARERGGKSIWCNGRITVEGFYRRFGFEPLGDVFELPGLGPHLVMIRSL